jgi:putative membrane protein insertion efficiency factor
MQRSVNNGLFILVLSLFSISCFAQRYEVKPDIGIIHTQLSQAPPDPYKRPYIYRDEPSLIKKFNPVGLLFGGSLYVYQNILSKHLSADCLFTPGCSEFSKQAIKETGLLQGTLLTIDRVNRCNRIAATDLKIYTVDPLTKRYSDPVSRHRKSSQYLEKKNY